MMFHVKKVAKKVAKMQHYIYLCIVLEIKSCFTYNHV